MQKEIKLLYVVARDEILRDALRPAPTLKKRYRYARITADICDTVSIGGIVLALVYMVYMFLN